MQFSPTVGHLEGFLGALAQRWQTWISNRDSLAGLDSCGQSEMARIARDLSLTTGELRALAGKGPGSANLLYRRMADLGLDCGALARSEPMTLRDMQKNCSLCESSGRCRHDLARGAHPSAWHAYCPNDDTLSALVAAGARHPRSGAPVVAIIRNDKRGLQVALLGFLIAGLAWLALLARPPAGLPVHSSAVFPTSAKVSTEPPVTCLDASCLTLRQLSAVQDLRSIQAQGWIATSSEELAKVGEDALVAKHVRDGEALACANRGGATYYGLMFQSGCGAGGSKAAKLDGINECRPMAGGGACLVK